MPTTDLIHQDVVKDEWLDGLGHMNMRYYLHAFTDAADKAFEPFFYTPMAIADRRSAVTAELHLVYVNDAKAREPFLVTTWIVSVCDRKLQLYQEMRSLHRDLLLATAEQMWLSIDLNMSKVTPFTQTTKDELLAMQQVTSSIPVPNSMGRAIGSSTRKPDDVPVQ